MKKRTRQFILVAAGILVFGLGTGLVASYMGLQNLGLIGRDGPAQLDYVPADAGAIAYANVRDVMDSELRKKLLQFHPGPGGDADRFQQETGIDIQTDIDEVVVAVSTESPTPRPLVIARGRLNPVPIEGLVRQHGGVVEQYRGIRLVAHPNGEVGVAFAEPGVVVVGTPAAVRRAIDTKFDGTNIRKNDGIMRIVRDVDGGTAWSVAHLDAITGGRQLPPEIASQLPPLTWVAASGYINGGVRGTVRAEARDTTAANDLRQVVQGFIALARLQVGRRPEFAELLNSLQLGGQGTTVSIEFTVPAEMVDALGAIAGQRGSRPDAPARPELRPLPAL